MTDLQLLANRRHLGMWPSLNLQFASMLERKFFLLATDVFVCATATPRARMSRASPPASRASVTAMPASPRGDIAARRMTARGRTSMRAILPH